METIIKIDSFISDKIKTSLNVCQQDPYLNYNISTSELGAILYDLIPFGQYKVLRNFVKPISGASHLVVKGLPTCFNALPPTPRVDNSTNGKDFMSENILLSFAKLLEIDPHVNEFEKDGKLFQQVIPLEGAEFSESGIGSSTEFPWHVENSCLKKMTNFFMLYCLRGDPFAFTTLYPIDGLIDLLPPAIIDLLRLPIYDHSTGPSFNKKITLRAPILENEGDFFKLRLNLAKGRTSTNSKKGQYALDEIYKIVKNKDDTKKICLEPGDLLLVNNMRAMHGRTNFQMHPDPDKRRWLQRLYCF